MIVVKVSGSLFDLPDLGPRLRTLLTSLAPQPRLLVPGGGRSADVVRAWDRDHALGPVAAHWLALRACTLNAWLLRELLPEAEVVSDPGQFPALSILDSYAFVRADEGQTGCLPQAWEATSDSVAARVAELFSADLMLLKSVSINPGDETTDWQRAAHEGHVDPLFPSIVARSGLRVRSINLRSWSGG